MVRGRRGDPRHRRDRRTDRREGRNKAVEVRIEQVQQRDLVASVTASGQVRPQTKVDLSSDISGQDRPARREGRPDGHAGPVPAPDRSAAARGGGAARRGGAGVEPRAAGAGGGQPRCRRRTSYERTAAIKKTNPQLISDEQLEQLRTAVDVNKALYEAAKHSVDQSTAGAARRQELARQDDDLRADVRPRDAPRRREGETADPGHVEQGRRHAAHDRRHERAGDAR